MTGAWIKVLVLVCIFGAVLLLVETLVSALASRRSEGQAINQRLRMIAQGVSRGDVLSMLRRQDTSLPWQMPPFLQGPLIKFERMLMAAGVTMRTPQLMLMILLAPFVILGFILLLMVATGAGISFGRLLLLVVVSGVIGAGLPLLYLQYKANQTRKKMQDQFPVALDVFVRGLRAGHPVAAALELLTVEMPDPIGSQFGVVVDEVTYGAELKDALQNMADRWDMDDMRMFVVSLAVQSETGGNLAEILENLSRVIRERASMMLKVRALSSEGRMSAVMLTALPILTFTGLFLLKPSFYLDVADDPAFVPGFAVLILLYGVGFYAIRRMVDLKV